ncbi:alpha/beta fold hydrolase [Actinomadura gamaensis]|uniref:Alpha/beta fold hydrolase n=1 Tax=Actinomadura gamaensis TaxID=1763541 RepID=A0ABV9UAY2_9ACTN
MSATERHALVFGATGFIGRHLVLELGRAGVRVSVATRSPESARRLADWLAEHGCAEAPADLRADFTGPTLLPDALPDDCGDVTEVYNCAAAYRFGMTVDEARRANVDSVRAIVAFAARLPRLRRLVHVSGYRVGGRAEASWTEEQRRTAYRTLGAYEASKVEADLVLRAEADRLALPWTVVNPSVVVGDSVTGESDQYIGLATTLKDLWNGALAAVPGNARTFVPVVAVDHLARFMTLLPTDRAAERASYWLLDDDTPTLPDLLTLVAGHYRTRTPALRVPVPVIRRLPRWITKADPEVLTFLSSDRYPTASARDLADRHGLAMPDTATTIRRWADHLAARRFGDAPGRARRFTTPGGFRTFELGEPDAPTLVLPGLPVNADTWAPVIARLKDARAVDLPGLGLSAGHPGDWPAWLAALLAETGPAHLVGHSIGAAAALDAASARPDAVDRLTLVAPFFLQPHPGRTVRWTPLTRRYLRRVRPADLARRLTGDTASADALETSVADLRRSTAATAARLLASTGRTTWRDDLQTKLQRYPGTVHIITGSNDPLTPQARALLEAHPRATLTVIPGAGHHPQLTHPDELSQALHEPTEAHAPRAR